MQSPMAGFRSLGSQARIIDWSGEKGPNLPCGSRGSSSCLLHTHHASQMEHHPLQMAQSPPFGWSYSPQFPGDVWDGYVNALPAGPRVPGISSFYRKMKLQINHADTGNKGESVVLTLWSIIFWQEAVNQQVNVFELTFTAESNSSISFLSNERNVCAFLV